jgi:mannose-6-phosphate isomerase-like protein (cupin superfamily)
VSPPTFLEEELDALLKEEGAPQRSPSLDTRQRLLSGIEELERFAPHATTVAEALRVGFHEARRALYTLSESEGWMSIPMLPGVRIRPVQVGARGAVREVDGAIFAAIEPGGRIPMHHHHGPEVMVVLQGALCEPTRSVSLEPGQALRSDDGTAHDLLVPLEPAVTCLCLVVNDGWAEYL